MNNTTAGHIINFTALVLLQVLVLNHINFLGYINPYLYILFIILYPVKSDRMLFLFLSFLIGLSIDLFSDSGGVHAAASVSLAFIRPVFLKTIFGALYEHQTIKFKYIDATQKLVYIAAMVFFHHVILFLLEVFNISKIILVIQKAFFSSIFTIILSLLTTVIFSRKTS